VGGEVEEGLFEGRRHCLDNTRGSGESDGGGGRSRECRGF
jgi:hypothetical protein